MAADVAKFQTSLDRVFKTFSTQEPQLDTKEMKGLGERGTQQYIEQKFQAHLQRARAAFLQEFRNHAVVAESEVRKIRDELTSKMEEKYGDQISTLRDQLAHSESLVHAHRAEIAQLKSLSAEQETYLTAARHHFENKDQLHDEMAQLKEQAKNARDQIGDLTHQLECRDELVLQLGGELSELEKELKQQAGSIAEEKRELDERWLGLKKEMEQQQRKFAAHLKEYEEQFKQYRAKTSAELQMQEILNRRLTEALDAMEKERALHIKARTKPTPRIGEEDPEAQEMMAALEERCVPYEMEKDARYRVDDMGMDTSWRDYRMTEHQIMLPPHKKKPPSFKVERIRRVVPTPGRWGSGDDTGRVDFRSTMPANMRQLPPTLPSVGGVLAPISAR
eukprot:TRINITY_DN106967_c0_g1_i1.p1 TRINITY_DN106967_c0_g1~~TRINITY_DN106967_c0_g1_i1.p1  ORF type:complete len:392 (+),score=101.75 TRINITY_DN106967_c0_g1_i1:90-1265(+)